jgi:hypothetical protein
MAQAVQCKKKQHVQKKVLQQCQAGEEANDFEENNNEAEPGWSESHYFAHM